MLSVLTVLVTPELLETGAKCEASNALGKNTTIIFLELGEALSYVVWRGTWVGA